MKGQQTGKPETSGTKRVAKRVTSRRRRKAEQRDPENAPIKNRYKGYTN